MDKINMRGVHNEEKCKTVVWSMKWFCKKSLESGGCKHTMNYVFPPYVLTFLSQCVVCRISSSCHHIFYFLKVNKNLETEEYVKMMAGRAKKKPMIFRHLTVASDVYKNTTSPKKGYIAGGCPKIYFLKTCCYQCI